MTQGFCQVPIVCNVPRPPHHPHHVGPLRHPHTGADGSCGVDNADRLIIREKDKVFIITSDDLL